MVAHTEAEGNHCPLPHRLHATPFRPNWTSPPFLFQDMHFAHKFNSSEWPLAHYSAYRRCCIIAQEALLCHGVPYNLPSYHGSQPEKKTQTPQTSSKISLTFLWPSQNSPTSPDFAQNFNFPWLETLISQVFQSEWEPCIHWMIFYWTVL